MTHFHTHSGSVRRARDRAFALGIGLNFGFVLVEAYFGWRAHSLALLADAGHNLSDVLGLVVAWAGALAARLPPDERHTYGWQRASILAAVANGLLLLLAVGGMAWEAAHRLAEPQPVDGQTMMAVAMIGVLINGLTAALFFSGGQRDLNVRGAFLHMAGDALVSLGVVAGGAVVLATGWLWLDPVLSLLIALVILLGTWGLMRQSLHLAFDGVPASVDLAALQRDLRALPGVSEIHDLHVWAMSTSETALTVHLVMMAGHPGDVFLREMQEMLHQRHGIAHPTVQIETSHGGCHLAVHRVAD